MAVFVCPACSHTQDAPDEYIGRIAKCLKCGTKGAVTKSKPTLPSTPEPATPPTSETSELPIFQLPPVEDSSVANSLTFFAIVQLFSAPFVGLGVGGSSNPAAGWATFVGGVVTGLILLGFARVIDNTSQSAQRLRRIEMLIQKEHDDKK